MLTHKKASSAVIRTFPYPSVPKPDPLALGSDLVLGTNLNAAASGCCESQREGHAYRVSFFLHFTPDETTCVMSHTRFSARHRSCF